MGNITSTIRININYTRFERDWDEVCIFKGLQAKLIEWPASSKGANNICSIRAHHSRGGNTTVALKENMG